MVDAKNAGEYFRIISENPAQTIRLGRALGMLLSPGSFVALFGDLGAGKTLLAKGIALGLGVADENEVASPTFVLINEYRGRIPIYHIDLYRLDHPEQVEGIGWDEILCSPAVTLVEWAERAGDYLPQDRLEVHMQWSGEESRTIEIGGRGRAGETVEKLRANWS